jgi:hypothetical protein
MLVNPLFRIVTNTDRPDEDASPGEIAAFLEADFWESVAEGVVNATESEETEQEN